MDRVQVINHNGQEVVLVDISQCSYEELITILPEAAGIITKSPPKSRLVLTDVTEANYNKDIAEAIKDFVKNNTPYIKASAVVGADGVRLILLQTVIFLSRREIKAFPDRNSALDWLTGAS